MKRQIQELLNLKYGNELNANDIFAQPEDKIFELRRKLTECDKNNEDYIVCSLCYQPVYIAGTRNGEFFFKHRHERGDCPIKTKGKYNQEEINRMKYNGVKESERHKELKDYIYNSLISDSRFSSVRQEKTIKSTGIQKEWKRPDVSSIFGDKKLVFEIQLSTTYLNVIVDRESFYRKEGIFILWVFDQFEIHRFTEKDIYYANKCNAFVIDDKTTAESEQRGELIFRCYYKFPYINNGKIQYKWNDQLVTFDDLCFDYETFKVYYFDLDQEEEKIRKELLVKDFEQYWLTRTDCGWEKRSLLDSEFCKKFSNNEIYLDHFNEPLEHILNALYSVKFRKMIGYEFKSFISLAHNILEYRKQFTRVFLWGLAVYKLKEEILNSDKTDKFRQKVDRYKDRIKNNDPAYKQEKKYDVLFSTLFPELREHLKNK
ncbi:DUF6035 family protein [Candidatus Marithrix sp. Canyon 246]|uniref:DUF6035 family protein n=1 Tax=Candidatus Marithrix sp. Canyon 246 TaxID=1827136 RepID=UPI000849EE48|nr:DUF6035 family protein [Candidatus Marithrix sp. Canyon 246]